MNTTIIYKAIIYTSLLAITFGMSSANAVEPTINSVERAMVPIDEELIDPLPPDDDPDAPINPVIPDPYAGLPDPTVVDAPMAKGEWIKITYLVYSGLPNPIVQLQPGIEYETVERALSAAMNNPDGVLPDYDPLPVLGYTGILIERFSEGTQLYSFTVQGDILSTGPESIKENYAMVSAAAAELETSLLSLGQSHQVLSPRVLSEIKQSKAPPYAQ
jgi:hypothetical protein